MDKSELQPTTLERRKVSALLQKRLATVSLLLLSIQQAFHNTASLKLLQKHIVEGVSDMLEVCMMLYFLDSSSYVYFHHNMSTKYTLCYFSRMSTPMSAFIVFMMFVIGRVHIGHLQQARYLQYLNMLPVPGQLYILFPCKLSNCYFIMYLSSLF